MHITRGAGKEAFQTLPPLKNNRFLPLVFLTDEELETLYKVAAESFPIFIDESNEDIRYKRNRIRKEIISILKEERINFYKFYWNFHLWENDSLSSLDLLTNKSLERKPNARKEYFQIPAQTTRLLNQQGLKQVLDLYLSLLGFPPLYKAPFDSLISQFSKDRAQIETSDYIIYREKNEAIHLLRKDTILFRPPETIANLQITSIKWNNTTRLMDNKIEDLTIRTQLPGEKMQLSFGKKEISEIFREHKIPYFLRDHIPIVYKKNLPIQILFSMFDPSLSDFPKTISDSI